MDLGSPFIDLTLWFCVLLLLVRLESFIEVKEYKSPEKQSKSQRIQRIRQLGRDRCIGASEVLVKQLLDHDVLIRRAVVEALGFSGDLRAIAALESVPHGLTVEDIPLAIQRIEARAPEILEIQIDTEDTHELGVSLEWLAQHGTPLVSPLLMKLIVREGRVRLAVIKALARCGDEKALKELCIMEKGGFSRAEKRALNRSIDLMRERLGLGAGWLSSPRGVGGGLSFQDGHG